VFQILANLEEIRPSVLIHAKEGACLFASYHDSRSNEERHYKVILTESLWRIEWKDKVGYPPCLCRLVGSKGEDSDWIDQSRNADQFIQKTHTELQKKHRINPYRPFEEVYRDHEKTLIKSLKIEL
jgi:ferredoxin-thioredoxin reductase catalytic subunit